MTKELTFDRKKSFILKPLAPYNFDATVFKPAHYPDATKVYEPGKYWFAMRLDNKIYGIKMENLGNARKPKAGVSVFSKSVMPKNEIQKVLDEVVFRFEFNRDISEFCRKFKNDKVLAPFIRKWYGMHGSCAQSLYGLLMIGILLQNTVVKRTVQMTKVMLEKYGVKAAFDGKEVYEFWTPEEMQKIPESSLRELKVGYRAKLFARLSETFVKERIDEFELRKLPPEEVKKRLVKLYGVGPETARILLQEAFHHYDVFDHVAPWQQKIYSKLLFNKKSVPSEEIIKYTKTRWGIWSVLAASYIWEDIFWERKNGKHIEWLEREIRM